MPDTPKEKWTEIEHLPEWDEEFYLVYTARKYGKWVMLKTLRPELRDNPEYQAMIEKEFDVRYNLCHPNIVMINDFEEVPGLGLCIITDDVYGESLAKILARGGMTNEFLDKIVCQLPEAIAYIQKNHILHHPIRPETIIFTDKIHNLKLIDVGFEQRKHLTPTDASEDFRNFGRVLHQAVAATPGLTAGEKARYQKVVDRCLNTGSRHPFRDLPDLKMALAGDSNRRLYLTIICFLGIMTIILAYLCWQAPSL